jgi:hypothetical protein
MRNFSKIDKGNIRINSLFFQPTNYCSYNCSGCYIKGRENSNDLVNPEYWRLLQHTFAANSSPHSSNQITLSVDSLPANTITAGSQQIADYMKTVFNNFVLTAWKLKDLNKTSTEFHITVHDPSSLLRYYPDKDFFEAIDLISLSSLNAFIDQAGRKLFLELFPKNTKINLNLIASQQFIDKFNQAKVSMMHVDYIYLILKKPDLGKHISQSDKDLFWKAYELISNDIDLKHKLTVDTCVQDGKKFGLTNYGCSANISKFQINPNGAVAGCPYTSINDVNSMKDFNSVSVEDLVEMTLSSIRYSNKKYDFKRCKIPQDLFPELPYNELKENISLRIIED